MHQEIEKDHGENFIDLSEPATSTNTSTAYVAHRTGSEPTTHGREMAIPSPTQ